MVQCLLEAAGYNVTTLDLAGAGIHPSDPDSVWTFPDYDKPLFDFMKALPKDDKVILVGHSAGGLSLVHIMHEFGEKIDTAIFVTATMLPSGFVSQEDKNIGFPDLSKYGEVLDKKFSQQNSSVPTSVTLKKEFEHKLLYQLSPNKDSTLASKLLRPWPIRAISSAKFGGGEEKAKRVRRVFIKTRHDRMMNPRQQDAMIRRWPPSQVLVIDTDHSPFFSAPKRLSKLIIQASVSK